jgi:hypothetical protein
MSLPDVLTAPAHRAPERAQAEAERATREHAGKKIED